MKCTNCKGDISDTWVLTVINEIGEKEVLTCCSPECCDDVSKIYARIHKNRYEDTLKQRFFNKK